MGLSKMEQRYDAVLGVIRDAFTVTEVARKFGVSRQSLYRWMTRRGLALDTMVGGAMDR